MVKEESEWLRGWRDQIKFIDLRFERWQLVGLSELCWGKATWQPIQCPNKGRKKKEESERLRGERDHIKFIDLGFERWQIVRFKRNMLTLNSKKPYQPISMNS